MRAKSSAHYQREYRRRLREQGLVKKEVWIRPEHARRLAELEMELRVLDGFAAGGGMKAMTGRNESWTTLSLYAALQRVEPLRQWAGEY